MSTMIDGSFACASSGSFAHRPVNVSACPLIAFDWVLKPFPGHGRRRRKIDAYNQVRILLLYQDTTCLGDFLVTSMQVNIIGFHFAEVLIRLNLNMSVFEIQLEMIQAFLCEHHVCAPACRFTNMILREAVN